MRKLNLRKIITMGLIATSVLAVAPVGANAEWRQSNNGWWYAEGNSYSRGWKNIGGSWYYFDNNGYMKAGWIQDNGNWYYLKADGTMATGTINVDGQLSHFYGDGRWQGYVTNNANGSTTASNNSSSASSSNQNAYIGDFNYDTALQIIYNKYKNQFESGQFSVSGTRTAVQYENGKKFYYLTKENNKKFEDLALGESSILGAFKIFEDGTITEISKNEYLQTQYARDNNIYELIGDGKTAEQRQREEEEQRQTQQYFSRH